MSIEKKIINLVGTNYVGVVSKLRCKLLMFSEPKVKQTRLEFSFLTLLSTQHPHNANISS